MKRIQSHPGTLVLRHQEATQEIIKRLAPLGSRARLLCFGSSWGAEVLPFALALPQATIVAAEIEQKALDDCAAIFANFGNVHVIKSSWEAIRGFGPFDAINCNAVFCKYPLSRDVEDISSKFSFGEFEDMAGRLVEHLKDDGIVSLYNSNYSLLDSDLGAGFKPFYFGASSSYKLMDNFVGQFDRHGRKCIHIQSGGAVFAIDVTERLNTDNREIRKSVAKLVNEGVFVKNPSPETAAIVAKHEKAFYLAKPDFEDAVCMDHNALYRVMKPHSQGYKLIPMMRYMTSAPLDEVTGIARFQSSIWWGDQVLGLPVTTTQ